MKTTIGIWLVLMLIGFCLTRLNLYYMFLGVAIMVGATFALGYFLSKGDFHD